MLMILFMLAGCAPAKPQEEIYIFYTSDVQYDPEDQAMSDLYLGMLNELDEIGFILPSLISE